jgi:hypothetical protein
MKSPLALFVVVCVALLAAACEATGAGTPESPDTGAPDSPGDSDPVWPAVYFVDSSGVTQHQVMQPRDPDNYAVKNVRSELDYGESEYWAVLGSVLSVPPGYLLGITHKDSVNNIEIDFLYQADGVQYHVAFTADQMQTANMSHVMNDLVNGIDFCDMEPDGVYDVESPDFYLFAVSEVRRNGSVVWSNPDL